MNIDMNKKSKFFNKVAEECVKQHVLSCRVPSFIGAGIIFTLGVSLIYLILTNKDDTFISSIYYIIATIIFFAVRINSLFRFKSLHKILYIDCDPQKYLDVMKMLLKRDKKKRSWSSLHILLARAYYGLNNYDAMKDCLDKINFKKKVPVKELVVLNLWGNYYLKTHQINELEKCCDDILQIKQNHKLSKKENIFVDSIIELWKFNLSIMNKEIETAQSLISSLVSKTKRPYDVVTLHFYMAEMELLTGNIQQVKEHLNFVYTYGNTMGIQKDAARMFKEI